MYSEANFDIVVSIDNFDADVIIRSFASNNIIGNIDGGL
jgi:hypothetical protein